MTKKMRTRSIKSKEITQLIAWGCEQCLKISDSPRLDAEILLTHSLGKPRSFCRTWPDKILSDDEIKYFESLVALRIAPTPIAYIVGYKEFWSRNFLVNSSTLVPRPDTELLIEKALDFLQIGSRPKSILDLGTGSGCIAITLKLECPQCSVIAADVSKDALSVAKKNAQTLLTEVTFIESSWFSHIESQLFDIIVSNPPYIAQHDEHLVQGDLPAEPSSALVSGKNGLDDIKVLIEQSPQFLKVGGMLMIEHGYDQKESVFELFKQNGFKNVKQYDDLGFQARLTSGMKQ